MIDKIVEMILEEARRRPGINLKRKIYNVHLEVGGRLYAVLDKQNEQERREKDHEKKSPNP